MPQSSAQSRRRPLQDPSPERCPSPLALITCAIASHCQGLSLPARKATEGLFFFSDSRGLPPAGVCAKHARTRTQKKKKYRGRGFSVLRALSPPRQRARNGTLFSFRSTTPAAYPPCLAVLRHRPARERERERGKKRHGGQKKRESQLAEKESMPLSSLHGASWAKPTGRTNSNDYLRVQPGCPRER